MDDWEPPIDRETRGRAPHPKRWPLAIGSLIAIGAFVAGFVFWKNRERSLLSGGSNPPLEARPEAIEAATPEPPPPVHSPADGDAVLRRLGSAASKSPVLEGWLASQGIVQRIVAAVRLLRDGRSPSPVLGFIDIEGEFSIVETKTTAQAPAMPTSTAKIGSNRSVPTTTERLFISPGSCARYDALTSLFTSIDPAYAGRAYAELRPYFESAFKDVAAPGERFDDVLRAALRRLVSVSVPDDPIEVVPRGAIYLFHDPALEALSPAEKHMLRMGPKNARAFQDALRRFAMSAGITL